MILASARLSVLQVSIFRLVTVRISKFLRPVIPVMKRSFCDSSSSTESTISVPASSGALVLRMLRGIPASMQG